MDCPDDAQLRELVKAAEAGAAFRAAKEETKRAYAAWRDAHAREDAALVRLCELREASNKAEAALRAPRRVGGRW